MLRDIGFIADRAYELWQSGWDLRAKEDYIQQVLHDEHILKIPPNMASRVVPHYTGRCAEKLELARELLIDEDGPQVEVGRDGASDKADRNRELLQEWLQGALWQMEKGAVEGLEEKVTEDLLVRSRAWVRVMPKPDAWAGAPELDLGNLDMLDPDEIERRTNETRELVERYRQLNFPIAAEWVPAESVFPSFDRYAGLTEVYEVQSLTVQEVLDSYLDEDGNPLAKQLQEHTDDAHVTPRDLVTLVVCADTEHIQFAVVSLIMDLREDRRPDAAYQNVTDEIIWEGPHHMGRVPYARFKGRERSSRNPVRKYFGFLDKVAPLVENLDNAMTQFGSSGRWAAWPLMAVERTAGSLAPATRRGGETPAVIQYVEGGVLDLPMGARLHNPGWIDSDAFQIHTNYIDRCEAQIDGLTFSKVVGGAAGGADSGYQYAQMSSNAEQVLGAARRGASLGWAEVCDLAKRAALCLMRVYDFDPIPVRKVDREAAQYITLSEKLAAYDADIRISLRARPVGGEAAELTMIGQMMDRGLIDPIGALTRLGDRTAHRTLQRVRQFQLLMSQPVQAVQQQETANRIAMAFRNQAAARIPLEGEVPSALAGQVTSPLLTSRLPLGSPPVGIGAQGGLPSFGGELNMAPPPPTYPSTGPSRPGGQGGYPSGQGQFLPGGLSRIPT